LNYSFGSFTTIGDYFQFALHFLLFHNTQYKRINTLPLDVPTIQASQLEENKDYKAGSAVQLSSPKSFGGHLVPSISLLFGENNCKSLSQRKRLKKPAGYRLDKQGGKIVMAAVLIGPKEVLVIVIITAVVVFLLVRRKRRD